MFLMSNLYVRKSEKTDYIREKPRIWAHGKSKSKDRPEKSYLFLMRRFGFFEFDESFQDSEVL